MPQSNTIYANFETVDLAEVAARQLKEHFKDTNPLLFDIKTFPVPMPIKIKKILTRKC